MTDKEDVGSETSVASVDIRQRLGMWKQEIRPSASQGKCHVFLFVIALVDGVENFCDKNVVFYVFGIIVVDVETNSLNIRQADLVGISLCVKEGNAYYIPLNHSNKEDKQIKSQLNTELVIKKIKPFLEDKSIKKIGHNIKYDFII